MDTLRDKENLEKIFKKIHIMKNNILVVGGTGFIGYHLANKLKKNNLVYSISTKKPSKKRNIKGIKYIYCDIYKKKFYTKIRQD